MAANGVAIIVNIDFAFECRCKLSSWWNRIRERKKRWDGEKRLLRPAGYFVRFRANAQTLPPASPVALFLHAWTRGTGIRREGRVASLAPDVRGHRRDQKNSFEIHEVVAIERERTVRFDRPNIYLHLNEIIARLLDL